MKSRIIIRLPYAKKKGSGLLYQVIVSHDFPEKKAVDQGVGSTKLGEFYINHIPNYVERVTELCRSHKIRQGGPTS